MPPNMPDNEYTPRPVDDPPAANQIYDRVVKADHQYIPDHEHQVTQQQEGFVDPTSGADGPHGSFGIPAGAQAVSPNQWQPLGYVDQEFVQLDKSNKWVELPDCQNKADEIKLASNLENATVATCKVGSGAPSASAQAAAAALESVTPKA